MKLLGGDNESNATTSPSMDSIDTDVDADDASTNEGFDAAADEMFSALETKDVASFTSALKTCLEMYK